MKVTEYSTSHHFRTVTESKKYQVKRASSCNYIQPFLTETSSQLNPKFSIFKPGTKVQYVTRSSKVMNEKAKNIFY